MLGNDGKTALSKMYELGTSPWIDNISRDWFSNGKLSALINSGVVGLTSNPAIFAAAIASTSLYDQQILELASKGLSSRAIALELAKSDITTAAKLLEPIYHTTKAKDGWASIEVDPDLAYLSSETLKAARALHSELGAPNIMVKIPATDQGLMPIREAITSGISVNVTLIFSLERYREVYSTYLDGAQGFINAGGDPRTIGGVASFFVSRIDSAIDPLLEARGRSDLMGKAALAQARLAYSAFQEISNSEKAQSLFAQGLRPQRPLFASTSTKNSAFPKLLYVENLIGADSVNTMPLPTLEEMLANGKPTADTVLSGLDESRQLLEHVLGDLGISMSVLAADLETQGVESFAQAWHALMSEIEKKIANQGS